MNDSQTLSQPLPLPCGATLPNRMLKSAMSEVLGTVDHAPSPALPVLYERWARGGIGLSITGNVMVDRRYLGEPRNVVIEDDRDLPALTAWAKAATSNGGHAWVQLNHPGKQSPKFLSPETVSASEVPFNAELSPAFAPPRAMTDAEIRDTIQRFGTAAGVVKQAGFTGVQIHGAHGYLVSQFLSPHHNRRTDEWGGSLENRARFVMEIYRAMRHAVGPDFPVSIKMNSADFQRGGFDEGDSMAVMTMLQDAGIDLIEVSGGTYEAPAMTGWRSKRTAEREGYFMNFVEQARQTLTVPIAVTGGFRSAQGMAKAIEDGADAVGLARVLAVDPDAPNKAMAGPFRHDLPRLGTGVKALDKMLMLDVTWYEGQLAIMGSGREPRPNRGVWATVASLLVTTGVQVFQVRRARS